MVNKLKDLLFKIIEFWLPKNIKDDDYIITLKMFIQVQFTSGFVTFGLYLFFMSLDIESLALIFLANSIINYVTIAFIKFGIIDFGLILGSINISVLILCAALMLGPKSNSWLYYIGIFLGNNFFIAFSKKIRTITNSIILTCFATYMVANWFQWVDPVYAPEHERSIIRFGNFNILYAFIILASFVSQFHKEMTDNKNKIQEQAKKIQEQFELVSGILNNIKQSIFTIDWSKKVVAPVSKFSKDIFSKDIENVEIHELLFTSPTDSSKEQKAVLGSTLDLVFGEDKLNWEMSQDKLPKNIEINVGDQIKSLKISYSDMRDQEELLNKILFVIEDVTEIKKLEEQIKFEQLKQKTEMIIFSQINNKEPKILNTYFRNSDRHLEEIKKLCRDVKNNFTPEAIKAIKGELHTFKGNSRALGFQLLSSEIHQCENRLISGSCSDILDCVEKIEKLYLQYSELSFQLKRLENYTQLDGESTLERICNQKIDLIKETAEDTNKKVKYSYQGDKITFLPKTGECIDDILTHILRNAVVHGIESAEQRLRLNKNPEGQIIVQGKIKEDTFEISIIDDGRGIDLNSICQKVISMGLKTEEQIQKMSDIEKMNLIFLENVTTQSKANEHAGRGVGLDFVSNKMKSINGFISVVSKINQGTEFKIAIPKS